MTTSLAGLAGLFREPPGLDAAEVSEAELESRRQLAWFLLAFDWYDSLLEDVKPFISWLTHCVSLIFQHLHPKCFQRGGNVISGIVQQPVDRKSILSSENVYKDLIILRTPSVKIFKLKLDASFDCF